MKSRCKARTKAGKPCGAAATAGGLCFFHANPNKAAELGRIGGRSKCRSAAESGDPLPTLDSAIAVRDAGARLFGNVIAGKVQLRLAAGLAPLMSVLLRAIAIADHEERITRLEQRCKLRDDIFNESAVAADKDSGSISD